MIALVVIALTRGPVTLDPESAERLLRNLSTLNLAGVADAEIWKGGAPTGSGPQIRFAEDILGAPATRRSTGGGRRPDGARPCRPHRNASTTVFTLWRTMPM